MRLVFDTNTIISAALFFNSSPAIALRIAEFKFEVLISLAIIDELEDVFKRGKFDKYTSLENRMEFLSDFINSSQKINIKSVITDCSDSKDNKFLELAIDGNADFIISGDEDLLVLHPYKNVSIVTASQFLNILL